MKARLIRWLLRQRLVQTWLLYAGRPAAERPDVLWTKEDATVIEGFLASATGQKLLVELENLKADADTNAVLRSTGANVMGQIGLARGVRLTVARIKQLTAVRQNPDTNEADQFALPADLAHLSDT